MNEKQQSLRFTTTRAIQFLKMVSSIYMTDTAALVTSIRDHVRSHTNKGHFSFPLVMKTASMNPLYLFCTAL